MAERRCCYFHSPKHSSTQGNLKGLWAGREGGLGDASQMSQEVMVHQMEMGGGSYSEHTRIFRRLGQSQDWTSEAVPPHHGRLRDPSLLRVGGEGALDH
ncbi:hypothetical protein RvY_03250 [Ramazzottius varieornatus]|uniref:Uncharacterized protein n=1 Tax=Ramazzottius varieornatus TaxID=947166 RepID=A0A1D1UMG1_RAMVA|nr:hypothetical protein RvY_03250 [Ramazzottius varieornatus]